jgi:CBS domain-containing membrane protein
MPRRTSDELRSHFEDHDAGHVFALIEQFRLTRLLSYYPARLTIAVYVLIGCFSSIATVSAVAFETRNPFVFPSLGPTAYLLFFTPLARSSSPKHAIIGHATGLVCGYMALLATHSTSTGGGLQSAIHEPTIFAAALSLGTTGAIMVLFRISHPPAAATTLIVSLGLLSRPIDLGTIEAAVFLLVVEAWVVNHLAGVPYPLWDAPRNRI